jgi:type IV fimbrial biogenesis protein FimT
MCVAIFSVSLTVIGPNNSQWIVKQNVISQTNELSALLRSARHRAIDHQDTVTICPSQDFVECSDNWNHALIAFVDVNTNLMKDDEERLLFVGQKVNRQVYITGPTHPIRFLDSGANSSPATLKLCPVNSDERLAKAIVVSLQGRVRVTKDSNNDGVDEIRPRIDIDCL